MQRVAKITIKWSQKNYLYRLFLGMIDLRFQNVIFQKFLCWPLQMQKFWLMTHILWCTFSVCFLYFNTAKNISRVIINGFLRFSASLIFFIPHQQIWDHEIDNYEVSYFSQYSENLQERYRLVFANSALKLMLRQVKMHPSVAK